MKKTSLFLLLYLSILTVFPILITLLSFSRVETADSTNFTGCSNFSQRNARRWSIPPLSGVASKKSRPNSTCASPTRFVPLAERFASAIRERLGSTRPLVFRRIVVKLSRLRKFCAKFPRFGFRFKGESNGGAHFSRSLSTSDRLVDRSAGRCGGRFVAKKRRQVLTALRSPFARSRRANPRFYRVVILAPRPVDFRATKSMGGEDV